MPSVRLAGWGDSQPKLNGQVRAEPMTHSGITAFRPTGRGNHGLFKTQGMITQEAEGRIRRTLTH